MTPVLKIEKSEAAVALSASVPEPKVSLVVPIFNVAHYLPRCLYTFSNQTLEEIEIILVDDGSTDNSSDILSRYIEVEPRATLITKTNGGIASARNAGLEIATGKYVYIVDSDDYLELDACEVIYNTMSKAESDVMVFGAHVRPVSASNGLLEHVLNLKDYEYRDDCVSVMVDFPSYPYVWRCGFRRQFLVDHDIWFDEEIILGEDTHFLLSCYPLADVVTVSSVKLYNYRVCRTQSAMDSVKGDNIKYKFINIQIAQKCIAMWKEKGYFEKNKRTILLWCVEFVVLSSYTDFHAAALRQAVKELLIKEFGADYCYSIPKDDSMYGPLRTILNCGTLRGSLIVGLIQAWFYAAKKSNVSRFTIAKQALQLRKSSYFGTTSILKSSYSDPDIKWKEEDEMIEEICIKTLNNNQSLRGLVIGDGTC